jgi:hypothetical protein
MKTSDNGTTNRKSLKHEKPVQNSKLDLIDRMLLRKQQEEDERYRKFNDCITPLTLQLPIDLWMHLAVGAKVHGLPIEEVTLGFMRNYDCDWIDKHCPIIG